MMLINNRKLNREYIIGGSGILNSILQFLIKTFTSQGAKELASSAAKEIGKTAAAEVGKKVVKKIITKESAPEKLKQILNKYSAVPIQDLVKKLND